MDYNRKIKGANVVFLVTVLVNFSLSILASILALFGIDLFGGSVPLQLLISQFVFVLPAALYLICFSKDYSLLRLKKIKFVDIILCIVFYICVSPVLTFLNLLSQLYSHNAIASIMYSISDEVPFVVGILLMAVIPAFCEEATYRGLFYNTYREKFPLAAIILSGLLFGLMHGNLNQFTYAFALGAVFALLVEATDSLWSSFTVHCMVNLFSTVLLYALPKALAFIQNLYNEALAEGDQMTISLIEGAIGTDDLTVEGFMNAGTDLSKADLLKALPGYAISAVIGGVLAFFILRAIAKRCGRLEILKNIFTKKERLAEPQPVRYTVGDAIPDDFRNAEVPLTPAPVVKTKLFTWELIAAMVIMIIEMVATEALYNIML